MQPDALIAFLNARLDEDEAAAETWRERDLRPLREVAAKRAILALATDVLPGPNLDQRRYQRQQQYAGALLALVAVYSDRPDYRQEWAP